jgi:uncharacterized protein (DUF1800 family)
MKMKTATTMKPVPDVEDGGEVSLSLTPYSGPWTKWQAAHLLRRALYGPTKAQINWSVSNGLNATVTQLMTMPTQTVPLTYTNDDGVAAIGETWVDSFLPSVNQQEAIFARFTSLFGWISQNLHAPNMSIQEKMTLFWQNHFAAVHDNEPRMAYDYIMLLRTNCLGNFRQLVKDMTINPQMLIFLNGATNNKFSPNENYARELFELYTIGKGPQIAPGDYTNYTEQDIFEAAKVLTGWTIQNYNATSGALVSNVYYEILHDDTTKTLSEKFNNAVITPNGADEYADLINVIFQQDEVARHICRKLYRWFVNYDLTPVVESTIIPEMADLLISSNYEIQPVMEMILKSEHFFDIALRGTIIKNPIEFFTSMYKSTNTVMNFNVPTTYQLHNVFSFVSENIGMSYFAPPQVAGWTAYYQQPAFSQMWINSAMIKRRFEYSMYMLYVGIDANGQSFPIAALDFLNNMPFPADPVEVINELEILFCCKPLSTAQKNYLRTDILCAGFPDFVWTQEYNNYLANPSNQSQLDLIQNQIRSVLLNLMKMPEFHII